jgi:hypothetical protein
MLAVTLIALTLQVVFGFIVGGEANYPATAVGAATIGGLLSAMWSAAGPAIFLHAFWGVLVVLVGGGTAILGVRQHARRVAIASVLGAISLLVALLGGLLFALSDFASGGGLLLMVIGVIAAYASLLAAFSFTRRKLVSGPKS